MAEYLQKVPLNDKKTRLKIVPEWDTVNVDHVLENESNCLGHVIDKLKTKQSKVKDGPTEENTFQFDHFKFMEYKKLQAELFEGQRLEEIRHGLGSSEKIVYTDDYIINEMFQMYGPMDTCSEDFHELFEAYKEDFLEEVADCEEREKEELEYLAKRGDAIIDPEFNCTKEIIQRMEDQFTEIERKMYGNLDPTSNEFQVDWFQLPRPKVTKIGEENPRTVNEKQSDSGAKEGETNNNDNQKKSNPIKDIKINLAVVDPKYMHPNPFIFTQAPLYRTLNSLIHRFPNGVCTEVFWSSFYEEKKYRIDYKGLGYSHPDEIMLEMKDVFHMVEKKWDKNFVVPSSFKGQIVSMEIVFQRIRHYILKSLEVCNGIIRVSRLWEMLVSHFGIKFNPNDWGFDSMEFCNEILKYNLYDIELHTITHSAENQRDHHEHFILGKKYPRTIKEFHEIQQLHEQKKTKTLSLVRMDRMFVPEGYLNVYEEIPTDADFISSDEVYSAHLSSLISPFDFSVIRKIKWNSLEYIHLKLSKRSVDLQKQGRISMGVICVGLPVLVFCLGMDLNRKDNEWHRGRIVAFCKDEHYNVHLIDFGAIRKVRHDQLRYFPEVWANYISPAIMCKLPLGKQYQERKNWSKDEVALFQSLCEQGDFLVRFKRQIKDPSTKMSRWIVFISVISKVGEQLLIPDLCQEFKRLNEIKTTEIISVEEVESKTVGLKSASANS